MRSPESYYRQRTCHSLCWSRTPFKGCDSRLATSAIFFSRRRKASRLTCYYTFRALYLIALGRSSTTLQPFVAIWCTSVQTIATTPLLRLRILECSYLNWCYRGTCKRIQVLIFCEQLPFWRYCTFTVHSSPIDSATRRCKRDYSCTINFIRRVRIAGTTSSSVTIDLSSNSRISWYCIGRLVSIGYSTHNSWT